jgi:Arc/MetJ-type ribon-helix-helix transcriptional regulator
VTHRRLLHLAQARRRLLHLRRASGCFGTSRDLSCDSSSTTSPCAGSLYNTSPTPRVRVPRHVTRFVTRLVAARLGASACRAARHAARRRLLCLAQARHRLLHLRRASSCFGTSRGLSRDSSSTTSPHAGSSSTTSPTPRVRVPRHVARLVKQLVVDYFTYAARPVARHVARLVA